MIQVQIASQLTRRSVAGLRWVLVETSDAAAQAAAPAPAQRLADAAVSAAQAPGSSPRATFSLTLLRTATLALGLVAAGWTASVVLGHARSATGNAVPSTSGVPPASAGRLPAAGPAPSASQAPATAPMLTAGTP